ncbi:LOW QUALITY PROTEIN: hypothetical protein TorRG33x02_002330, partial [Trema orientale]
TTAARSQATCVEDLPTSGATAPINDHPKPIKSYEIVDTNQSETRRRPEKETMNDVDRVASPIASTRGDTGKSASNRQLFLES